MSGEKELLDAEGIRSQFPALRGEDGQNCVYLDSAATSLKPQEVVDAVSEYYSGCYGSVHRGVHEASRRATHRYESARERVRRFIGAGKQDEVVFLRSATEAINLVAFTYGRMKVKKGDEIVLTGLEHHSNIVPWQMLALEKGAKIVPVPVEEEGTVSPDSFRKAICKKTRLVAMAHLSNVSGSVLPVAEVCSMAHEFGAAVLVDGAQAVSHLPVDIEKLGCDFYVFSGHKVYGPSGTGVLWGREELLNEMPPWQGGGDMIQSVSFDRTIYAPLPRKFEAGTPDMAGAAGLEAAINWLEGISLEALMKHEEKLTEYAFASLSAIPQISFIGSSALKTGLISFSVEGLHPHDIGTFLDQDGIAVRTGHFCAEPYLRSLGINAALRISFAAFNTKSEIDRMMESLERAVLYLR